MYPHVLSNRDIFQNAPAKRCKKYIFIHINISQNAPAKRCKKYIFIHINISQNAPAPAKRCNKYIFVHINKSQNAPAKGHTGTPIISDTIHWISVISVFFGWMNN